MNDFRCSSLRVTLLNKKRVKLNPDKRDNGTNLMYQMSPCNDYEGQRIVGNPQTDGGFPQR